MKVIRQKLFFDRTDICTGTSEYLFQESRMTPEGREKARVLHDFWNFCMTIGPDHGARPLRVPFGIRFAPEKARVSSPILPLDRPWEQGVLGYVSAAFDQEAGLFRVWYNCKVTPDTPQMTDGTGAPVKRDMVTYYAESRDLENWVKPALGILFCGGESTNAVSHTVSEGSIFLDPDHPDTGRVKGVNAESKDDPDLTPIERVDLCIYRSDDGIHFEKMETDPLHYFFDTQNVIFYDPGLGKYTAYLRGHYNGRAIQRSEADEICHLPMPQIILFPDNEDPLDCDYYNNACTLYPYDTDYRIMLPSVYLHCSDELEVRMAYSRNGRQFQWISRDPVIAHHDEAGRYFSAAYACPHMLPLGDRVGVLLRTAGWLHNDGYFADLYGSFDVSDQGIRLATWEKDRLAGIEADGIGEFWVQMRIPAGARLQVNARTSGQGRVSIALDAHRENRPISGFSAEDCAGLSGDMKWQDVSWNGVSELPQTPDGQDTFLHVRLEHGKIFGLRLVTDSDAAGEDEKERIASAHL